MAVTSRKKTSIVLFQHGHYVDWKLDRASQRRDREQRRQGQFLGYLSYPPGLGLYRGRSRNRAQAWVRAAQGPRAYAGSQAEGEVGYNKVSLCSGDVTSLSRLQKTCRGESVLCHEEAVGQRPSTQAKGKLGHRVRCSMRRTKV